MCHTCSPMTCIDGTDQADATKQIQCYRPHRNDMKQKEHLELITPGTNNYDVDSELFSHVAKYIANSH